MDTNVVFAHERRIAYQRACEFRSLAPAHELVRGRALLHEIVCLLTALARSARERAR